MAGHEKLYVRRPRAHDSASSRRLPALAAFLSQPSEYDALDTQIENMARNRRRGASRISERAISTREVRIPRETAGTIRVEPTIRVRNGRRNVAATVSDSPHVRSSDTARRDATRADVWSRSGDIAGSFRRRHGVRISFPDDACIAEFPAPIARELPSLSADDRERRTASKGAPNASSSRDDASSRSHRGELGAGYAVSDRANGEPPSRGGGAPADLVLWTSTSAVHGRHPGADRIQERFGIPIVTSRQCGRGHLQQRAHHRASLGTC